VTVEPDCGWPLAFAGGLEADVVGVPFSPVVVVARPVLDGACWPAGVVDCPA